MKKILSVMLSVIIGVGLLSSCGAKSDAKAENKDSETGGKKYRIAFASNSYADKWQTYLNDAANKYAEEHDVELIMSDGKEDAATQLNNVETAIADGVDAVCIVMVDPDAPAPFVSACKAAGIPLVAVNRKAEGVDVFVGSDDILAGNIQGEFVAEKLNNKGSIAILDGMMGQNSQVKRTEGFKQSIEPYQDLTIVLEDSGKWDRAKGMEIMENWISTGTEIDAVVANNDEMAIGAINALKAAGKLDNVIVGGVDATPDALEYVKSGELAVTCFQSPFGQGSKAVEQAIKLINKEDVPEYIDVPFEKVTKENVDEYIDLWK